MSGEDKVLSTVPLFDAIEGGLARTRSLCDGNLRDQKDFTVTFPPPPPANQPPVANAGVDQAAACVDGGAQVTLDGSQSSDPDSDPIEFHWLEAGSELASVAALKPSRPGPPWLALSAGVTPPGRAAHHGAAP